MDEMQRHCIEEKCYTVVEMLECELSKLYKTDVSVKEHLRESFPYKCSLRRNQLLDKIKSGALLGYLQRDINVRQHLTEKIANFAPFLKNKLM